MRLKILVLQSGVRTPGFVPYNPVTTVLCLNVRLNQFTSSGQMHDVDKGDEESVFDSNAIPSDQRVINLSSNYQH